MYKNGISKGQFSHVLLHEMDTIRKACASLEEGYMPPVTFVVVQRRHHTGLFPEVHGRRDMTDKSGNILPETVVDLMICHPTEFDFYLCSHAGIQGTSRPTHYHVLYDENHFTADAVQSLTNNLCYTYARCTCAVSLLSHRRTMPILRHSVRATTWKGTARTYPMISLQESRVSFSGFPCSTSNLTLLIPEAQADAHGDDGQEAEAYSTQPSRSQGQGTTINPSLLIAGTKVFSDAAWNTDPC